MPRLKLNGEQEVRTMFLKLMRRRRRGEVYILIRTKNDSRIGLFWRGERKNAKRERIGSVVCIGNGGLPGIDLITD